MAPGYDVKPRDRVQLLVGTRKGLFRARAEPEASWTIDGPHLAGWEVYHTVADPGDPETAYAAVNHVVWGNHVFVSRDGGRAWEALPNRPRFPETADRPVERIWYLAADGIRSGGLYAGVEPAALFHSEDGGGSWRWIRALDEHPTRESWQPARGGLCLHSIQVDPREPRRLYVGVSAGGCYRTEDGGASWLPINAGIRAEHLPDPRARAGHNPHALRVHPRSPDRLWLQGYDGVYRSDDRGETWTEVTVGLPSGFGYAVALDPDDPDRCWVVPEEGSHLRCVCGGRLRVYETRDAGATWIPRTEGLPQEHAYVSVLREALCTDARQPCGVYLGTSTGHLFASRHGTAWDLIAGFLPAILSVTAVSDPPATR